MITRYNFRLNGRVFFRRMSVILLALAVAGCTSRTIQSPNGIVKRTTFRPRVQPTGVERSTREVATDRSVASDMGNRDPVVASQAGDVGRYFDVEPVSYDREVPDRGETADVPDGHAIVRAERVALATPMVVQTASDESSAPAAINTAQSTRRVPAEPSTQADDVAVEDVAVEDESLFPVDLPTALQLAGANSLQVAMAAEQLAEAFTLVDQADARWFPSVRVGFSYNRHNGRIQVTDGSVIEASRGSFFAGGGVGTGSAPLTGGSGGPFRFAVDLSVADIVFEPLAARRVVEVASAEHDTTFNQTLLEAGAAYLRLVTAQAQLNTLGGILSDVQRLVDVAEAYAAAGEGKIADLQRAKAELARWEHAEFGREEEVRVASVELARILRLEPGTLLTATDSRLLSWSFFGEEPVDQLIAQAVSTRPEMSRAFAQTRVAATNIAQEHWRPLLPHLTLGFSGGAFGGEGGSQWKNVSDRTDVDVGAIWEMENLGWGNAARRELAANRHRRAHIEVDMTRDRIISQVLAANQRCRIRRASIRAAQKRLDEAVKSMEAALLGIREGVQLPVEGQQSVVAVADARLAYLDAISSDNLAQLQLLYAVGKPVSDTQLVLVK